MNFYCRGYQGNDQEQNGNSYLLGLILHGGNRRLPPRPLVIALVPLKCYTVEMLQYNFLIGCPLPRRNCLGALTLWKNESYSSFVASVKYQVWLLVPFWYPLKYFGYTQIILCRHNLFIIECVSLLIDVTLVTQHPTLCVVHHTCLWMHQGSMADYNLGFVSVVLNCFNTLATCIQVHVVSYHRNATPCRACGM